MENGGAQGAPADGKTNLKTISLAIDGLPFELTRLRVGGVYWVACADAGHADLCTLEAGGTRLDPAGDRDAFLAASRFRMSGPALYRATARILMDQGQDLRDEAAAVAAARPAPPRAPPWNWRQAHR